jgi:hypothetical protein
MPTFGSLRTLHCASGFAFSTAEHECAPRTLSSFHALTTSTLAGARLMLGGASIGCLFKEVKPDQARECIERAVEKGIRFVRAEPARLGQYTLLSYAQFSLVAM